MNGALPPTTPTCLYSVGRGICSCTCARLGRVWRNEKFLRILNLGTRWRWVVSFTLWPLLS